MKKKIDLIVRVGESLSGNVYSTDFILDKTILKGFRRGDVIRVKGVLDIEKIEDKKEEGQKSVLNRKWSITNKHDSVNNIRIGNVVEGGDTINLVKHLEETSKQMNEESVKKSRDKTFKIKFNEVNK